MEDTPKEPSLSQDPASLTSTPVTFPAYNIPKAPPTQRHLPVDEQRDMMGKIQEILELEEDSELVDQEMADRDDEGSGAVDLEDRRQRTQKLVGILTTITELWWSGSEQMDLVVEKLADSSRDPRWRVPLGDSGVLGFFVEIFNSHTLRHVMCMHVLRLIGNSCADTDENRARIVASNGLSTIIFQLNDTSLLPFVLPVLYNICIDYEPAQQQASQLFLTKEIIELISSSRFNENRSSLSYYICKLLDFMVGQPSDPELAPENTPVVLLRIAAVVDKKHSVTDMGDFVALVNTAAAYLQYEKFQKALISLGAVDTILAVLVDSYTRFDSHPSMGEPDEDDAKSLIELRSNLNQVLSDISALPEFKAAYPVISPLTMSLRRWLLSPQLQLQVCACIMLGNLARSDEACEEFVQTCQVHQPLISILKDANNSQLLHAALGFLKNLALPAKNKETLGNAGLFDVLPRLWALDTLQQIQFSSIALARQLTIGTFENVRNVCKRLSQDEGSPANIRTKLSLLIALFERTDAESVKMEIARLIASVTRVFTTYTGRTPEQMTKIRIKFFRLHPDVGRPLSFMVSQTKWPVVRSEGWFVFAIMARFPEGAQCISDLMHDVSVFQPLVQILTGKDIIEFKSPASSSPVTTPSDSSGPSPTYSGPNTGYEAKTPESVQPNAQAAEMERIDRENALVLVSELLKNRGKDMAVMRRALFEDLLKGGGELVLSYKELSPTWGGRPVPKDQRLSASKNLQQVIEESTGELYA